MAAQQLVTEKPAFAETAENRAFQVKDMHISSSQKRHFNASRRLKEPEYRRINHYFKSIKQYQKERERRRNVRQLHNDGFTFPQIARQLKVSERTIHRDVRRQRKYLTAQHNKLMWQFATEERQKVEAQTVGMTNIQAFKFLTREIVRRQELLKITEYHKHTLSLTVNIDEITNENHEYGRPFITFSPKRLNCDMNKDFRLKFYFQINGQRLPYATLQIGNRKEA